MSETNLLQAPRGLKGVIVADTELGDVRGLEGFYHYRQYSAPELAATRTFEDVWYLLFEGRLPSLAERDAFTREVAALRELPPSLVELLPADRPQHQRAARRLAHRALAARRARGHAAHLRRRRRHDPRQRHAHGGGGPRAHRRAAPLLDRQDADRTPTRPRHRRELPLHDRRRRARRRPRPRDRAVPHSRDRPRLQRVDVHRARRDLDRRRRRLRRRRRARLALGPAARRRAEPRARHARRDRDAREHRRVGAPGDRQRRPHHGLRPPRVPHRRSPLGDAARDRGDPSAVRWSTSRARSK